MRSLLRGICLLVVSGCALQSNLVDVEDRIDTLEKSQQKIHDRLNQTENRPSVVTSEGQSAEILVRLEQLQAEIKSLTGRGEEDRHRTTQSSKKIEDVQFKAAEVGSRLNAVETRLLALEKPVGNDAKTEAQPKPPPVTGSDFGVGTPSPTEAYRMAYNDYLGGKYDLALLGFGNFLTAYPGSSLIPGAIYWMGECHYKKKEYLKAIESFGTVQKEYPQNEKAPQALLKQGLAHLALKNKKKARLALNKVIEQFPNSNESAIAKNRLRTLN